MGATSGSASFSALSEDLSDVFAIFSEVTQQPAFAQDKIVLYGPVNFGTQSIECDHGQQCGLHFIARYAVPSDKHSVQLDDGTVFPNRWGFISAILNWEKLLEQTKIHQDMAARGFEFQIRRTDETYDVKRFTYKEAVTVLTESADYDNVNLNHEVEVSFMTANDIWEL